MTPYNTSYASLISWNFSAAPVDLFVSGWYCFANCAKERNDTNYQCRFLRKLNRIRKEWNKRDFTCITRNYYSERYPGLGQENFRSPLMWHSEFSSAVLQGNIVGSGHVSWVCFTSTLKYSTLDLYDTDDLQGKCCYTHIEVSLLNFFWVSIPWNS